MLVQSHTGVIHLLPALPDEFETGKVKGLKARGGYKIDMEWKKGELKNAVIYAGENSPVPAIRLRNNILDPADPGVVQFVRLKN
jgi:hypothetical protein